MFPAGAERRPPEGTGVTAAADDPYAADGAGGSTGPYRASSARAPRMMFSSP